MKEEKEMLLILRLLNSPFLSGFLIKGKLGTLKQFEIYLKASENNSSFLSWIKQFLIFVEKKDGGHGKFANFYKLNGEKLVNKLRELPCYNETHKFFNQRAMFGISR